MEDKKVLPTFVGLIILMQVATIGTLLTLKPPVVNVNLQPLYDEIAEKDKEIKSWERLADYDEIREHEDTKFIYERCVCLNHDATEDTGLVTKQEICSNSEAEEPMEYSW